MSKVLILTAGYGEGHNSAARALKSAFDEQSGIEAELVDLFALHSPRLNNLTRRGYLKVINSAPKLWNRVYRWLDESPRAPTVLNSFTSYRHLLARVLAEKKPVALVSTYPVYGWMLNQLRAEGREIPPLFTVVTDALTINSLWYRTPSDGWFVTDADSALFLREHGVPAHRVHHTGFPVALAFADRAPGVQPPEPASPAQPRRVLFMINTARDKALPIARALVQQPDWQVTFTAGRSRELQDELAGIARGAPARTEILGWTDRIPELLMTHHVVISKAGGATTQESINALCPLIVSQVVPGQEEGNYELLRRHDAGALATTPREIVTLLKTAFAHEAVLWRHWRKNLRGLARPAAARTIAARVLESVRVPAGHQDS